MNPDDNKYQNVIDFEIDELKKLALAVAKAQADIKALTEKLPKDPKPKAKRAHMVAKIDPYAGEVPNIDHYIEIGYRVDGTVNLIIQGGRYNQYGGAYPVFVTVRPQALDDLIVALTYVRDVLNG